jgi:hypothetical protein
VEAAVDAEVEAVAAEVAVDSVAAAARCDPAVVSRPPVECPGRPVPAWARGPVLDMAVELGQVVGPLLEPARAARQPLLAQVLLRAAVLVKVAHVREVACPAVLDLARASVPAQAVPAILPAADRRLVNWAIS